ncbi:MAG: DNA-formamidopyrimidine glycosylase family protein [Methanobacteriaceae archaeon]|nr:DNA-formamidopyrimidine glycosylase family protein [Methanobacteriaceae archaeon]
MPELPSVEVYKNYFDSTSLNQIIKSIRINSKEILTENPLLLKKTLKGHSFTSSGRYGKYLFAYLDNEQSLVFHFGMTGSLKYGSIMDNPYSRFVIHFQNSHILAFIDPRKFGRISLTSSMNDFIQEKKLGPDALHINYKFFKQLLKKRRGTLKPLLLNQNFIAGIGNLYADEILYQSHLHPLTHADELKPLEIKKLFRSIRKVLKKAIEYMDEPGNLPDSYLLPHRYLGGKCPCGGSINVIKVAGRTTYFCPECQKLSNS